MARSTYRLAFEQPIYKLEERIAQLEQTEQKTPELRDQIKSMLKDEND